MTLTLPSAAVERAYHPHWPDYFDVTVLTYVEEKYAVDAHDNICVRTRDRLLTNCGTWESPYFWEAYCHIEEVTRLPDDLVWIRVRHLYTGTDYSREEWEAKEPGYSYIVARRGWLDDCQRAPVHSKVWTFDDDDVPLTPYYPWRPPTQSTLPLLMGSEAAR